MIDDDAKTLVIARLETLNQDSKILLMGEKGPTTVKDMIDEVRKESPLGKKIVELQLSYIKTLASGAIDL